MSGRDEDAAAAGRITAWIGLPAPLLIGHLLQEDFDSLVLDMQHGMLDVPTTALCIAQSLLTGKPAFVRIPVDEFATASRVLDAGASGVIAPMINSASDAERFVSFVKFPPAGKRSWGPGLALNYLKASPADYLATANGRSLAIAMIETHEALAAIDDILAVDGLDGVLLGPSDLSIALSRARALDAGADLSAAIDTVAAATQRAGKQAWAFCPDGTRGADLLRRGFNLVAIGTEAALIRAGARAEISRARAALA